MNYFTIEQDRAEEHTRIDNAYQTTSHLLCDPIYTLTDIAEKTVMSLTELRYAGWENLYDYIRGLENQVEVLKKEKDTETQKLHNLVVSMESVVANITNAYRSSRTVEEYSKEE